MKHKTLVLFLVILCVVGIATVQVRRYFASERRNPSAEVAKTMAVQVRFPETDDHALREGADAFRSDVERRVKDALLGLASGQRPSSAQAERIARSYATFLVLRRTATREEYIAGTDGDPIPGVLDEDQAKADSAWKYNSAWARCSEISVDTIEVAPVFSGGRLVGDFEQQGTRALRHLRNGRLFSAETVGTYSVYEILIDIEVPDIGGGELYPVTLRTMLINDGPHGEWSPVSNEFIGVPQGKYSYVPSP